MKSGFGGLGIALLMLYIALYADAVHGFAPVSPWAAEGLHWLYGANAQALFSAPR